VESGPAPRAYTSYGDAIGDLEERLGTYCSYCERRLPVSLAVEHMSPKSIHPDLELIWDNFLLGCTNCNSVKGDTDTDDDETLWPDRDNTLLALTYSEGGFVGLDDRLNLEQQARARVLIDIVGLDRHRAQGWPRPAARDKRWQQRDELWAIAKDCVTAFEALGQSDDARSLIISTAKGYGFLSVWLTVFDAYPAVKLALIEAFPGTAKNCFDDTGGAVNRPGGAI
jgi:uncharacterized protein (TIGR02646 family)